MRSRSTSASATCEETNRATSDVARTSPADGWPPYADQGCATTRPSTVSGAARGHPDGAVGLPAERDTGAENLLVRPLAFVCWLCATAASACRCSPAPSQASSDFTVGERHRHGAEQAAQVAHRAGGASGSEPGPQRRRGQ